MTLLPLQMPMAEVKVGFNLLAVRISFSERARLRVGHATSDANKKLPTIQRIVDDAT